MEQGLLVAVQQVVAPFDEPLQRDPRRIGCRRLAQEGRPALEDRGELPSPSTFTRAAASSIANGSPSTRRAISPATRQPRRPLEPRPRRTRALEEQLHRRRAAPPAVIGDGRGATGTRASSATRSASRLVARIRTAGHSASSVDGDPRRLVEHVLARVEDDERAASPKTRRHARQRVGAANVEGVGEETNGVRRFAAARGRRPRCRRGTRARANARPRPRAGSCPRRAAR